MTHNLINDITQTCNQDVREGLVKIMRYNKRLK